MPRNGSGTQQTPNTFVDQTTITAGAHNANWADAASEITNSLALDGQSQMSGQLKIANGSVSAPGLVPGSDLDTGLYRIGGDNLGVACAGAKVLDIATTGLGITGALTATTNITATGTVTGATVASGSAMTKGGVAVEAFASGTAMMFVQTSAPTGWTKSATHNDKTLRVVSGTASSGGTVAFSTVFARTSTDSYTLQIADIPSHDHPYVRPNPIDGSGVHPTGSGRGDPTGSTTVNTTATGGGGGHSHGIDLRVQYVDCIIATKD
jgi:hypothetical protein